MSHASTGSMANSSSGAPLTVSRGASPSMPMATRVIHVVSWQLLAKGARPVRR